MERKKIQQHYKGEQRRSLFPNRGLIDGAPPNPLVDRSEGWESKFNLENGLHKTKSGLQLYWESIAPADQKCIDRVLVVFHGLADSVGFCTGNTMLMHAQHHNVAIVGMDLPGHGRSDGLHMYIHDWHDFVEEGLDFVNSFCKPKLEAWRALTGRPLQMYGHGESLGGGFVTSMCLKQPDLFDGVVLVAPMVFISDEMMPPAVVVWLFEHVVVHLMPTAKVAPSKDIGAVAWSDPSQREIVNGNPLGMRKDSLRVRTAYSMIMGTRWMSERLHDFRTPFLVLHAKRDKVCEVTDSAISQRLFEQAATGPEDKKIVLLDNDWHADFMTGGPTQKDLMKDALDTVVAWLKLRDSNSKAQ